MKKTPYPTPRDHSHRRGTALSGIHITFILSVWEHMHRRVRLGGGLHIDDIWWIIKFMWELAVSGPSVLVPFSSLMPDSWDEGPGWCGICVSQLLVQLIGRCLWLWPSIPGWGLEGYGGAVCILWSQLSVLSNTL